MRIPETACILEGVELGEGACIGDFVIIGLSAAGLGGASSTRIGAHAVIRSHTVIYAGSVIGEGFATGHGALIRECTQIGDDVSVGTGTVVEHHVRIGRGVRIHSQAFVPEFSVLEDECWLGPNVVLTNAKYPRSKRAKENLRGPMIGKGAKIGANSTLLPGVRIGEGALVGAGSVVTRDVPDGVVVVGNPAKVVKRVDELRQPGRPDECPYGNCE